MFKYCFSFLSIVKAITPWLCWSLFMDRMEVLVQIRASAVAPVLRFAVFLCLIFSVMLMLEKVLMGAVSLYAKIFQRRPEKMYKCEPIRDDEEIGTLAYPIVLVQIPMYNEKQVKF